MATALQRVIGVQQAQPLLAAFELVFEALQLIWAGAMAGLTQGMQGALVPACRRAQIIHYIVHAVSLQVVGLIPAQAYKPCRSDLGCILTQAYYVEMTSSRQFCKIPRYFG
jgi:hypothetical protein